MEATESPQKPMGIGVQLPGLLKFSKPRWVHCALARCSQSSTAASGYRIVFIPSWSIVNRAALWQFSAVDGASVQKRSYMLPRSVPRKMLTDKGGVVTPRVHSGSTFPLISYIQGPCSPQAPVKPPGCGAPWHPRAPPNVVSSDFLIHGRALASKLVSE